MIDQSHNLKGEMEAMVQSVTTAQEFYAKAALVQSERLDQLQSEAKIVEAEELFVPLLDRCSSARARLAQSARPAR